MLITSIINYFLPSFCTNIINISITDFIKKKDFKIEKKSPPLNADLIQKSCSPSSFFLYDFFSNCSEFFSFLMEKLLYHTRYNYSIISNPLYWISTLMFFILILLLGLYHEWNQGALEWTE
uniref:NADH dehydrogenase subunit 3 n=1 Tax=Teleogryllus infernalis TaxID=1132643 RepID=A0A7L9QCX2_9ORTH|nr:NADH dehydrogenase subunit 3 [Teleogryllus infernalis]